MYLAVTDYFVVKMLLAGLPVDRLRLYRYKKIKLEDDKCLADYFLLDGSEIDVFIEPPQPPSATLPSKNKPPLPLLSLIHI